MSTKNSAWLQNLCATRKCRDSLRFFENTFKILSRFFPDGVYEMGLFQLTTDVGLRIYQRYFSHFFCHYLRFLGLSSVFSFPCITIRRMLMSFIDVFFYASNDVSLTISRLLICFFLWVMQICRPSGAETVIWDTLRFYVAKSVIFLPLSRSG